MMSSKLNSLEEKALIVCSMNTYLGLGHYFGSDNLSVRPAHDSADIEKILVAISLGFKNVNIKISHRDNITVSKFGITISLKSYSQVYGEMASRGYCQSKEKKEEKLRNQLVAAQESFEHLENILTQFVIKKEEEIETLKSENLLLKEKISLFQSHDGEIKTLKKHVSIEKEQVLGLIKRLSEKS
ncbi:Oidioi.mRNA.OKI2018_I69.PAR.g9495.t1.cds [Oikopleura dioica]|uniref:Oidioi.mRNA.OKI2018_I69.PAR.g9495.t1.cds n=1 Tax=Oikopleura dioica TaxID=34765 RepID=A0ABN7RNP8_OIKDI|nr:Oidioi.mRNA.OKI2018_I69.PAR.g9495.t1.cds [Oikopleura dioica]